METVHVERVGDQAVLPLVDLERLVEIARRTEEIEVRIDDDEIPSAGIVRLAELGHAFDWLAQEEDLYSVADLKVRYR